MKVKELLNLWINGHNQHILSVPWRDLSRENVPYGLPFPNGFGVIRCLQSFQKTLLVLVKILLKKQIY